MVNAFYDEHADHVAWKAHELWSLLAIERAIATWNRRDGARFCPWCGERLD